MVDEKTFAEATSALFPILYRVSMGILRSDADAQDALQQSLEKAWIHREKIKPEKLRAWLTKTMIHECRNIQRHRMRITPTEKMDEVPHHHVADASSDVSEVISSMPDNYRIPLLLKYSERYSEKEIAETLRMSIPAVKNRLFRARKALEKALHMEVEFE